MMTKMNAPTITINQEEKNPEKNKSCCWNKNPNSLMKGPKLVAIIHAIGTIGMVAGLIYATINMDTIYKEVSLVNVNQLPYVIQHYIFTVKNNEVAEGQEAEKKGEGASDDNPYDSFTIMKRATTKGSSVSKSSQSQSQKIDKDDNKKKRKSSGTARPLFVHNNNHNKGDGGSRRKRSNSKKSKKPMISQALATNVLIGISVFHVIHVGLSVLLFLALSKKKWILMIPWMFSEFFRQLIFLGLYGFIIYSSFPAITLTAEEDKIAKFQIPFLVIILLIIVLTFVLWGIVIGALRNLCNGKREINPKSDFLRNLFMGKFKKNSSTTINTVAEVPSATPIIPKSEENSNLPAKPVETFEVEEYNTIHNIGHARGIWAW